MFAAMYFNLFVPRFSLKWLVLPLLRWGVVCCGGQGERIFRTEARRNLNELFNRGTDTTAGGPSLWPFL